MEGRSSTLFFQPAYLQNVTGENEWYNPNLVGGAGTAFSTSRTGMQYAKVDGLDGDPGYLTSSDPSDILRNRLKVAKAAYVNVSTDGMDIPANEYWTTESEKTLLDAAIAQAEGLTGNETEDEINAILTNLNAAINAYEAAKKAGKAPSAFTVNSEKSPTYNAYRLFKGSVENKDGKNVMSGITLDPSVNATALKTFLQSKGYTGDDSATAMAEFIANKISEDAGNLTIPASEFLTAFATFQDEQGRQFAINYPGSDFDPVNDNAWDWINQHNLYNDFYNQTQDNLYNFMCEYGYQGANDMGAMQSWYLDVSNGYITPTSPAHADTVNAEGFPIVNSDAFAMDLAKWVKDNVQPVTTVQAGNKLQGDEGYYLLINQSVPANWAGTAPIWVPLGGQPVEITEKVAVPTLNKQVRENSLADEYENNRATYGTSVVSNVSYPADNVANIQFQITGLDDPAAVQPEYVITRFGKQIPLNNGAFDKSFTVSGSYANWDIIVDDPLATYGTLDPTEYNILYRVAFVPEYPCFFDGIARSAGGGLQKGPANTRGTNSETIWPELDLDPADVGDCWIIHYADGTEIEVYPDGQLDVTTIQTIDNVNNTTTLTAPINAPASTAVDTSWGKAADAQVGEAVPYRLTATLPDNYSSFASYALTFEDQLANGMVIDLATLAIKVVNGEGQSNTADITSLVIANGAVSYDSDSNKITVNIPDLKAAYLAEKGIVANSHIVVEYSAFLDANYNTGTTPNTNTATLTYTADPVNLVTTATTLPSTANLYTYDLLLIKTDANTLAALGGAQFTIMRDGKYVQANGTLNAARYVFTTRNMEKTIMFPSYYFDVRGLDAGVYTISEVVPPSGYELFDGDLTLTITRTLNQETGAISNFAATLTGGPAGTTVVIDNVTDGYNTLNDVIVLTVPNTKEITFPITGLSGNAIFYAIAGLLAVIAIVGFIVSRKNTKNKKAKSAETQQ